MTLRPTFGIENDLLSVLPGLHMVHIPVVRVASDFPKGFSVVGKHTEQRCASGARSAKDEELTVGVSRACVNRHQECAYHFSRIDLA